MVPLPDSPRRRQATSVVLGLRLRLRSSHRRVSLRLSDTGRTRFIIRHRWPIRPCSPPIARCLGRNLRCHTCTVLDRAIIGRRTLCSLGLEVRVSVQCLLMKGRGRDRERRGSSRGRSLRLEERQERQEVEGEEVEVRRLRCRRRR